MSGDPLKEYRKKRDFDRTPEPKSSTGAKISEAKPKSKSKSNDPIFVIQNHDASRLHYDLRLEVDGVLASWAMPKGPSTDPKDKRLAIRTEDHPVSYADFEGVIPEDEYGGGTVMVWDTGTYRNNRAPGRGETEAASIAEQLENGRVSIWLEGEKIRGGYKLARTRMDDGDREQWLLIKVDDDHADARRNPTSTQKKSVKTGRTLKEIEEEEAGSTNEKASTKKKAASSSNK